MRRLKPYQSRHKVLSDNKRMLDFLAMASDKVQPPSLTRIPPAPKKRVKTDAVSEADVNKDIRQWALAQPNVVLWRNNRGVVETQGGGRITYGVGANGACDWLGYKTITVTPEMVGKRVAVFLAVESKRPGVKARPNQVDFMLDVARAGGISGVASSTEELETILRG